MERCVSYVASSSRSKPPVWQTGFFEPLRSGLAGPECRNPASKIVSKYLERSALRLRRRNLGK